MKSCKFIFQIPAPSIVEDSLPGPSVIYNEHKCEVYLYNMFTKSYVKFPARFCVEEAMNFVMNIIIYYIFCDALT